MSNGLKGDAKEKLTTWLTKNEHPDANTEFPTPDALRLQEYYRILGEEFSLPSFTRKADRIATMMWSFKRQSRGEAVKAMFTMEAPRIRRRELFPMIGDVDEKAEE